MRPLIFGLAVGVVVLACQSPAQAFFGPFGCNWPVPFGSGGGPYAYGPPPWAYPPPPPRFAVPPAPPPRYVPPVPLPRQATRR